MATTGTIVIKPAVITVEEIETHVTMSTVLVTKDVIQGTRVLYVHRVRQT